MEDFVRIQDTPEDMLGLQITLTGFSRTVMLKIGNVLSNQWVYLRHNNYYLHVFVILNIGRAERNCLSRLNSAHLRYLRDYS